MRSTLIGLLCLVLTSPALATEYYVSDGTKDLGLPFSDAVRVGDLLILSGQLGMKPRTLELAEGGIEGESRQALENIKTILEANDLGMNDVVKCTVMLVDIAEWPTFNEIYVTYFPGNKPARSAFAASGLALGGRVEVECWAAFD